MNRKTKALLAVITGNTIFGFSFLFSKIALALTIPSVLIATRFTAAFLVLNLIVLIGRGIRKSDGSPMIEFSLAGKPFGKVLILALFQPVIYFIAENYGIMYTSSAFAGAIIAVIPIAGIVFDIVMMHSKVTHRQILCAICSVIGVVLTSVGGEMTSSLKGIIFLIIAVSSGAMFYVFSKGAAPYFNALERTYVMFGVGCVVYVILALIQCFGKYDTLVFAAYAVPSFWISILYLSIVSSVLAFLLLNYGSNYVSVSQATMFANLTTVISIVAGVVVLHESFGPLQVLGAAIILASVYMAR